MPYVGLEDTRALTHIGVGIVIFIRREFASKTGHVGTPRRSFRVPQQAGSCVRDAGEVVSRV